MLSVVYEEAAWCARHGEVAGGFFGPFFSSTQELLMQIELERDAQNLPARAIVTIGSELFTLPIRKSVEGWEASIPSGFSRHQKVQVQLVVAALILGLS